MSRQADFIRQSLRQGVEKIKGSWRLYIIGLLAIILAVMAFFCFFRPQEEVKVVESGVRKEENTDKVKPISLSIGWEGDSTLRDPFDPEHPDRSMVLREIDKRTKMEKPGTIASRVVAKAEKEAQLSLQGIMGKGEGEAIILCKDKKSLVLARGERLEGVKFISLEGEGARIESEGKEYLLQLNRGQ